MTYYCAVCGIALNINGATDIKAHLDKHRLEIEGYKLKKEIDNVKRDGKCRFCGKSEEEKE